MWSIGMPKWARVFLTARNETDIVEELACLNPQVMVNHNNMSWLSLSHLTFPDYTFSLQNPSAEENKSDIGIVAKNMITELVFLSQSRLADEAETVVYFISFFINHTVSL